ncbi:TPA: Cki family colicin immunity protein [Escherichia coli]
MRYLLKKTTKTDKEPWYLYNILYISYIAMAIPIGLPSLIYYIFKKS